MKDIMEEYQNYLRGKYRKRNTIYGYYEYAKLFLNYVDKDIDEINKDDLKKWHIYITDRYEVNGNIKRIQAVNDFFRWLGKDDLTLPISRQ